MPILVPNATRARPARLLPPFPVIGTGALSKSADDQFPGSLRPAGLHAAARRSFDLTFSYLFDSLSHAFADLVFFISIGDHGIGVLWALRPGLCFHVSYGHVMTLHYVHRVVFRRSFGDPVAFFSFLVLCVDQDTPVVFR
jgi:hypothetical protein